MKSNFWLKLKTFAELGMSLALFYFVFTYSINFMLSVIIVLLSIFILFQALDNIDKINHYGPYNTNKNDSSDNNPYIKQNKWPDNDYHNHPPFNKHSDSNPYADDNDVITDIDTNDADEESSLIDFNDFIE